MSNNFTLFNKKELTTKEKEGRCPCRRTIISIINYSKSIEIRKTEQFGKMLFVNN